MRRPAVRLLLTLALSACVVGAVPAATEAGIIPWAYDAVFGPVGSLNGRYSAGYNGGCATGDCSSGGYGYSAGYCGCGVGCFQGPAPRLFGGLRARRRGYVGYAGYAGGFGGGFSAGGCSTGCGYPAADCGSCNSCGGYGVSSGNCGSCGAGGCGIDGGFAYGASGYGGGCATGQCGVNYGPTTNAAGGVNSASPVTPASPPPATTDNNVKSNGPTQYDAQSAPMGRSGANDGYLPPVPPGEGFRPRGQQEAAPTNSDPAIDEFVPPKVNSTNRPAIEASPSDATAPPLPEATNNSAAPTDTTTPPVPAKAPKRNFGDDEGDNKETQIGPRLELQEKITWNRSISRSRQMLSAVRVSATVNRTALFPKMAWKTTADAELAKK